jgi:hypothetical protein
MAAIQWDDELRIALIQQVQLNRHLWDISMNHYRNKMKKEETWDAIGDALSKQAPFEISGIV